MKKGRGWVDYFPLEYWLDPSSGEKGVNAISLLITSAEKSAQESEDKDGGPNRAGYYGAAKEAFFDFLK